MSGAYYIGTQNDFTGMPVNSVMCKLLNLVIKWLGHGFDEFKGFFSLIEKLQ